MLATFKDWERPWRGSYRTRMDNKPLDRSPSLKMIQDPEKREALSSLVELVWIARKYVPEHDRTIEYIHAIEVLTKAGVDPDEFFDGN